MRAEYLLFDLIVAAGPVGLSLWPKLKFGERARHILWGCLLMAIPFILWDAAVVGRHWWFDARYTLGIELFGLPIEEILFFVVVPYACLFSWETVIVGKRSRVSERLRGIHLTLIGAGLGAGAVAWSLGLEYTSMTAFAVAVVAAIDLALGTVVLRQPRYWAFLVLVSGLTLVFNGYLTGRPVVHYGLEYQLGIRIGTVPVEDLVYGAALVTGVASIFQRLSRRVPAKSWLARLIERGLGGYRHPLVVPDDTQPIVASGEPPRAAVIGGGLAGLSAAALLAERGVAVTVFERNPYLGGKVAGWSETLEDGFEAPVEHGFHAFFRHYYNLDAFLERIGLQSAMKPVGDYVIATRDGRRIVFDGGRSTPILNLVGLARKGLYSLREVATGPAGKELEAFMRYDPEQTFAAYDDMPFDEFCRRAELPSDLRLVFNTFARAFFADDDRLSTAELIKSFHFYYLSHDEGLGYDFLRGNYEQDLIDPIVAHLRRHGVEIRTSCGVERIERAPQGTGLRVDGRAFEHVVLAADVAAARGILERSPVASEDPELLEGIRHMHAGQRYSVLRLWVDVPSIEELPVFVATERIGILDAVSFIDRIDPRCERWAGEHRGGVIELHSYAIPDDFGEADAVRDALVDELQEHFGEYRGLKVVHEHLQIRDDFTALHVGMAGHRPGVETGIAGLTLAGDWVALPCPAMLMEAAHTSGLLAANAILRSRGLREHPAATVPRRGLMAGWPKAPVRRRDPVQPTSAAASRPRA